mmetsp:Transcript_14780/g.36157  ORF Transcript_14780/g.36157 Transcript_14780/m.36157 type:complete len:97 (-) Transcript_14780:1455-1745(-)
MESLRFSMLSDMVSKRKALIDWYGKLDENGGELSWCVVHGVNKRQKSEVMVSRSEIRRVDRCWCGLLLYGVDTQRWSGKQLLFMVESHDGWKCRYC